MGDPKEERDITNSEVLPKEQEVWASHWAPLHSPPARQKLLMGEALTPATCQVAALDSPQEKPSAMLASVPVLPPKSLGTHSLHRDSPTYGYSFRPGEVTVLPNS